MVQKFQGITIQAIAASVPQNTVSNSFYENLLNAKNLRKFEKTTGIKERRHVKEGETACDLGFHSAKLILEKEMCSGEIGALIFVSQTSEYKIPFTSNILQDRLRLPKNILCIDINAGCAGAVQGLSTAYSLANSIEGKVLLVISETLSKILSPHDRSTTMLFGDAGAALLIGKSLNEKESYFNFFSDGSNFDAIIIPDGGYKNPFSEKSLDWEIENNEKTRKKIHLKMKGPKVFDFTLREIPDSIKNLLSSSSTSIDEIDYCLFHQSNKFIINQIASRLSIPKEKVLFNIDKYGNTSGVSIPLLLVTEYNHKNTESRLLLSGYGSGLTWGNCVIHLDKNFKNYGLIEI